MFTSEDLSGRPVRRAIQPHIPRPTRRDDSHGHRRHAVRVHPAVDHAPVLEGPAHVPEVQVHVGQRDTADGDAPQKGKRRDTRTPTRPTEASGGRPVALLGGGGDRIIHNKAVREDSGGAPPFPHMY